MRSPDFFAAAGIGVSDLARSLAFYQDALGMKVTQTFKLDYIEEVVLAHRGRNAVVLMHWTDGSVRNYRDLPVKLVFYVVDPVAVAGRIAAAGCEMMRAPAPIDILDGVVVGLAKDPDGYIVELVEATPAGAVVLDSAQPADEG